MPVTVGSLRWLFSVAGSRFLTDVLAHLAPFQWSTEVPLYAHTLFQAIALLAPIRSNALRVVFPVATTALKSPVWPVFTVLMTCQRGVTVGVTVGGTVGVMLAAAPVAAAQTTASPATPAANARVLTPMS